VELGKLDAPEEVSSETREKLQALGYVGVASAAPVQGELPDPKDKIASYEDLKRAQSLRHQRKDAEAVAAFRKVVADNPRMLDAWELLGTTLVRMGRFAEGTAALVEALKLDPERSTTHMALVKVYALQGKQELAQKHAEIAATRNPAEGYETLAQLMLDVRQPERAAEYARRSLAADPQRTMSHWVLGTVARRAGRYEEAVASFRRAEESKKHRKTARVLNLYADIGDCLARLGRLEEAEQALLQEVRLSPRSQEGRLRLAMLYRSQARDAEARQVLAGLIEAEPQPGAETYWTVVRAFGVLGDVEAARAFAAKGRALFPGDPRFRGAGG
jgi:tetratricopeptide (TPR) repeat protein